MRKHFSVRVVVALLGLSLLLAVVGAVAGCRKGPDRLVLGIVAPPSSPSPGSLPQDHTDKLARAITEALATGTRIEIFAFPNSASLIKALGAGSADIAVCNPFAYVVTQEVSGTQVLFKTVSGSRDGTRSEIVALAAGGPRSLGELKGKTVGFADPASPSGYLFPAAYLVENGVLTATDLGRAVLLGDETAALRAVLSGEVAAAACSEGAIALLRAEFPDVDVRLAVIASTPWVPGTTVAVRAGLAPELVDKVKLAIATAVGGGEGRVAWGGITGTDGIVEATDADYDIIRKMAEILGIDVAVLAGR